jgi:hypothetical protein
MRAQIFHSRLPLLAAVALCGLVLSPERVAADAQDDATHNALVERIRKADFTVDFRQLRLLCIKASNCEPRGTKKDLTEMSAKGVPSQQNIDAAERILRKGYPNVEVHATLAGIYLQIGGQYQALAQFHMGITKGILQSIFKTGDGKSKETALEVISDREEYSVMSTVGLPYMGPSVISVKPERDAVHSYDVWTVRNKAGEIVTVYFNTDAFSPTKSRVGKD